MPLENIKELAKFYYRLADELKGGKNMLPTLEAVQKGMMSSPLYPSITRLIEDSVIGGEFRLYNLLYNLEQQINIFSKFACTMIREQYCGNREEEKKVLYPIAEVLYSQASDEVLGCFRKWGIMAYKGIPYRDAVGIVTEETNNRIIKKDLPKIAKNFLLKEQLKKGIRYSLVFSKERVKSMEEFNSRRELYEMTLVIAEQRAKEIGYKSPVKR